MTQTLCCHSRSAIRECVYVFGIFSKIYGQSTLPYMQIVSKQLWPISFAFKAIHVQSIMGPRKALAKRGCSGGEERCHPLAPILLYGLLVERSPVEPPATRETPTKYTDI